MTSQDSFDPHTFLTHIGAGRTIAAYRQHSPERAKIDMMNQHWHAIPWPIRVVQIAGLIAVVVGFYVAWKP